MVLSECECQSRGGGFFINEACTGVECPHAVTFGACCWFLDAGRNCFITAETACQGNHIFQPGQTCEAIACTGTLVVACCCRDSCIIIPADQCFQASSVGSACVPDPCGAGACCDPLTGLCISLPFPGLCEGEFRVGGACNPNPCPPPATGACCHAISGNCSVLTLLECVASGGYYIDDNTACEAMTCTGACCLPPVFAGVPTSCRLFGPSECAVRSGVYHGAFTTCGDPSNPVFCCAGNFNGRGGVTIDDLFDFLAAYFSAAFDADFNHNGSVSVQDIFDYLTAFLTPCR